MALKGVIFDIDDVLYDGTSQARTSRRAALDAMIAEGLEMSLEQAEAELDGIVEKYGSNYSDHFGVLVRGHTREPVNKVVSAGVVAYHNTKMGMRPFPDARKTLKELSRRGLKLGVVSNGRGVKQWEKLIRLGLEDFFDAVVISEEEGSEKPDPGLFVKAAGKLDLKPDECAYVGDKPHTDIAGANRAGMTSIRMLKGRFKETKPQSKEEEADLTINRLSELLDVIE